MQISPRELRDLASSVDDLQNEAMRTFHEETAELHLAAAVQRDRRRFLKRAGVGGAAVAFGSAFIPITSLLPAAAAADLADDDIAAFAESVELAAVAAYTAGAPLLSEEVLPVGKLFMSHHQAHAAAFAKLGGDKSTGLPNAKLVKALQPTLDGLKTEDDVLEFAFKLENEAAVTYAYTLTVLTTSAAYSGTATILPIETAHAAALGMALGKPMTDIFPSAFESTDIANGIDPAQYPVS